MLARYLGRLHPPKTDVVKCGAHKCSSILDTTSKEAIGKSAKVQVRRDYYATLFRIAEQLRRLKGRAEGRMEGITSRSLSDVRSAPNDIA